ncbi:LOW QUALITY PROTEIN: X-ray radiation resistance-associated protein 1-like [Rhopilema esculentum]|uniref:LOW QUALITY PROTEIN: X-ray radiation resistance-associated protein 1-like n=1 Tax=Rhopilema esculentum TaxID=499914 RepID=UPI0031D62F4D
MAYYASQCFPARNLLRFKQNSDGGAWLIAYREEQSRRFDAVLCPDAKTEQRRKALKEKRTGSCSNNSFKHETYVALNGIYLLKNANVDNPSDVAYLNISGKSLAVSTYEDFVLFDNVIHIEANENNLTLETFRTFPALRELELQLNNIRSMCITSNDFKSLEFLDLSFNNITEEDILKLGMLTSLRCLYLSGNGLKRLPVDMAHSFSATESQEETATYRSRFQSLEVLYLDENKFEDTSIFASLAALKRLRVLSLSKNNLRCMPHLRQLASPPNKPHLIPCGKTDITQSQQQTDSETQPFTQPSEPTTELPDELTELPRELTELSKASRNQPRYEDTAADSNEYFQSANCVDIATEEQFEQGQSELKAEHRDTLELEALLGSDPDLEIPGGRSNIKLENALAAGDSNFDSTDLDLSKDIPEYPFQNLEILDISYNKIAEEHVLLPLTAWPSLLQVNLWENPLTKKCKGTPPLLNHHLTKLCGIQINRKEPKKMHKPAIGPKIAPAVRHNKVNDILPPMRRKNMLMLEFESYEAALQNGSLYGEPLPPITPTKEKQRSKELRDSRSAPAHPKARQNSPAFDSSTNRPHSVAADQFFGPIKTGEEQGNATEAMASGSKATVMHRAQMAFFLLRLMSTMRLVIVKVALKRPLQRLMSMSRKKCLKTTRKFILLPTRQMIRTKLLRIEGPVDEMDTPPAVDLRGNIKALKNALNHPLVFNEPTAKEQEKQTYTRRSQGSEKKSPMRTKRDKVNTALEKMRTRNDAVEENLDVVLQKYDTDPETRKKFPEVKTLLKQVQSKYNEVRQASLESATTAHAILHGTNTHDADLKYAPSHRKPSQGEGHPERFVRDKRGKLSAPINVNKDSHLLDVGNELERFKERVGKRI